MRTRRKILIDESSQSILPGLTLAKPISSSSANNVDIDTLSDIVRSLRQKLEIADKLLAEYDTQLSYALDVIHISQRLNRPAEDGYIKIGTILKRRAELRQRHSQILREDETCQT